MYTIEELNRNHDRRANDIVCHITSKEQWQKLKEICPGIATYIDRHPYYTTIEFSEILFEITSPEIY